VVIVPAGPGDVGSLRPDPTTVPWEDVEPVFRKCAEVVLRG
jgi:hypothetical protein